MHFSKGKYLVAQKLNYCTAKSFIALFWCGKSSSGIMCIALFCIGIGFSWEILHAASATWSSVSFKKSELVVKCFSPFSFGILKTHLRL